MRKAEVYINKVLAGTLTEVTPAEYVFRYDDLYLADTRNPSVSLTLDRKVQEHKSDILFPFFFNMLSEGHNRRVQSRYLHVDEEDHFGILLATAGCDTPGAVTVKPV